MNIVLDDAMMVKLAVLSLVGLVVGYLIVLFCTVIAPFLARVLPGTRKQSASTFPGIAWLGIFCAALVFAGGGGAIFPLAPLLLIPLLGKGYRTMTGGAVALLLFAPMIWWNNYFAALPVAQWIAFVLAGGLASWVMRHSLKPNVVGAPLRSSTVFVATAVFALVAGWWSAPFHIDMVAHTAWHHWGAYLSPVDLLLSGGVPYRDFPVQYGIGPTVLIAASCGTDCWNGMFHLVMVVNAIYLGALASCAVIIVRDMNRGLQWLAIIAMCCATLLWTAFPAELGTAMATPSVAGLRFLPIVALLLFILNHERRPVLPLAIGHAIWFCSALWSIEAAAFASMLWWPWLAYRALKPEYGMQDIALLLLRYAILGLVALVVVAAIWMLIYTLAFGGVPDARTLFAYFENPPGPLPPNPYGPLGLVFVLTALAIHQLVRRTAPNHGMLYACVIAMLAAFSYYLSRSHDNNILNLLPFVLLVALTLFVATRDQSAPETGYVRGYVSILPMAAIAFVALFNFSELADTAAEGKLPDTGPAPLMQQFSPTITDPKAVISKDAIALIAEARRHSNTAPLLFDERAVMPWVAPGQAWTNVNSIANYSPLPRALSKIYIARGAKTFNRSGWLIVEDGRYADWPATFATAYTVCPMRRLGRYTAYGLTPRTDDLATAFPVGANCSGAPR